jgi:hypothetical protein
MLVDDMAEINPEYLHLLKNCAVTFVVKPPGKDVRRTLGHTRRRNVIAMHGFACISELPASISHSHCVFVCHALFGLALLQILSKKIGLVVESIQTHRAKLRFAYRAQSYRLLLQRLRERKKKLGLSNRDSIIQRNGALPGLEHANHHSSHSSGSHSSSWEALQHQTQPTHGSLLKHRLAPTMPSTEGAAATSSSALGVVRRARHVEEESEEEGADERAEDNSMQMMGSINAESLAAIAAMNADNATH